MNKITTAFNHYLSSGNCAAHVEEIIKISTPVRLVKDQPFVTQGVQAEHLFYIDAGITRHYVVNTEGIEANKTFTHAPCIVSSTRSLVKQIPSGINVAMLKDATGMQIQWAEFRKLMDTHHDIDKFYRLGLERLFIMKEERESSLLLESAEERYLEFLASHQDILDQIPQYHIASYLGINPVSLSRIRKQINDKDLDPSP